jgi:hypothetical protein
LISEIPFHEFSIYNPLYDEYGEDYELLGSNTEVAIFQIQYNMQNC